MKLHDGILGVIIAILGISIFLHSASFPDLPDGHTGPGLFPMVLATLFAVCGVILAVQGFRQGRGKGLLVNVEGITLGGALNILVVIGLIVFYLLCAEILGFIITMFVVLIVQMLMLKTPPLRAAIVSACATIVIYLIFYKGLLVPLPEGILSF
ncbi:MAG: tripartite tricarboxylate transporter TctB family protein [Succinivibrionaceae bacterium]|nr:tripartite tricarboxylate transporter TctB family protein [Succinivibrionaceae bacterium]